MHIENLSKVVVFFTTFFTTCRPRVLHDIARCLALPGRGRWRHSAPPVRPSRRDFISHVILPILHGGQVLFGGSLHWPGVGVARAERDGRTGGAE